MSSKSSELTWTTKDGRKLRPEDFEDLHLKNTIAFIKARERIIYLNASLRPSPALEHLFEVWERDVVWTLPNVDGEDEAPPLELILPIYGALLKEAKRRGL